MNFWLSVRNPTCNRGTSECDLAEANHGKHRFMAGIQEEPTKILRYWLSLLYCGAAMPRLLPRCNKINGLW